MRPKIIAGFLITLIVIVTSACKDQKKEKSVEMTQGERAKQSKLAFVDLRIRYFDSLIKVTKNDSSRIELQALKDFLINEKQKIESGTDTFSFDGDKND